jgi:hypothetical protein
VAQSNLEFVLTKRQCWVIGRFQPTYLSRSG